jgi:hypothetical protein
MQSQQPDSSVNTQNPADSRNDGAHNLNPEAALASRENNQPKTSAVARKTDDTSKHWLDYLTAGFAFIAGAGAIIAAIFTGWQATIADKGMRISNRAYVSSTSLRFTYYGLKTDGKSWWEVAPLIENTGNTGTHDMRIKGAIMVGSEDFNWSQIENGHVYQMTIAPKSDTTDGTLGLTGQGLNQLGGGSNKLVGAAVIRYRDVFGDIHLLEFCHYSAFSGVDWEAFPVGQSLRLRSFQCKKHNCEDDECGSDWKDRANRMEK